MSGAPILAAALLLADGQAGVGTPPALGRFDDKLIAEAVRATVAEMPRLKEPEGADFGPGGAAGAAGRRQIDRAFEAAAVPECHRSDAMKHAPPVVHVAGVPIVLGGLLALPNLVYAASTGKCK